MALINTNQNTGGRPNDPETQDKLNAELARLLYKQAPLVSISLYAVVAVVVYFFWNQVHPGLLWAWAGANFTFCTLLLVQTWRYWRKDSQQKDERWIRDYIYLVFLQEFSWGMTGPLSFMIENEVYRLLTLFMLGGIAAGAIATRGIVFRSYVVSITSLLTPIIVTLVFQDKALYDGMLVLTLIFYVSMLSAAKHYSTSIRQQILLLLDNARLIVELQGSKAEIEQVNEGLLKEIEQRKRMETELLKAKERAEHASEAKNQFLANVSHELRTPLNGIIGFSSILEKFPLSQEQTGFVRQIYRSAKTLLRNVNDILDITAIEAGHIKISNHPFSLRTELNDVITLVSPLAEKKQLMLRMKIDESTPDSLLGDARRLMQVITNLLSNAIKYTEMGFIELRVRPADENRAGYRLLFEVEDTGIGIPKSAAKTVFENFSRVENFNHKRVEGVGLGLAIVKNLLTGMDGIIWLDSTPGKGSTFSFEIPFGHVDGVIQKDNGTELRHLQSVDLSRMKVLVVDDNEINRIVLTTLLRQHDIVVEEAADGNEALKQITEKDFDGVLLDIQMPELSGTDVARLVRKMENPTPPLIAVTAHAFPEQREEIIGAGFNDFLVKPIDETDLLRILVKIKSDDNRKRRAGNE